MYQLDLASGSSKAQRYADLTRALAHLLEDETDALANLSNAAALLAQGLERTNWVGFYILRGDTLVLGPFQGKPACVRIPLGKGVCGTAAARRETLIVPDVHAFPGHIACDADSRSEIVVPIVTGTTLRGVLDLDSPEPSRFDEEDRRGLEGFVAELLPRAGWARI